ncbi:protein of unknown function [Magnetospira sp. QH-2]|nr:protein of unknown function [Magnetospira sp. QH-2]
MQLAPIILAMFLMADPPTGTDRPSSFEEGTVVPYPIPPDICVEAHLNDELSVKRGYRLTVHRPPVSHRVLRALEYARQRGLVHLRRCAMSKA